MQVGLLLGASGALTGGLVGLVAGTAWQGAGLDPLGAGSTALVVLAALGADLGAGRWSWARPLSLGRQVPVAWGRLLDARVAAALYGARLGIGPSTILRTWTWWAALVTGASLGPWPSAAVGTVFALTRTATTIAVGGGATTGVAMGDRVAGLVRVERAVAAGTACALAILAASVVLA